MKVVILCGGMGTRLREQTETRPKPMVEVGGTPLLLHIMRWYAKHGFREFVLALGYKGRAIRDYFLNFEAMSCDFTIELGRRGAVRYHGDTHETDGWSVTLADTGETAGTGARIARVARHLGGEPFAVTYGDGVSDIDLAAALEYHRSHGRIATVTGVRPPSRFGEIDHRAGEVLSFNEKPQATEGLINGGFFFFEPKFLEYLSDADDCALEREPLERCVADRQLRVYEHAGFWQCMDTYRDWQLLETQWSRGTAPWRTP
jgi:glucose-1-phosphate cytidylyltransferase